MTRRPKWYRPSLRKLGRWHQVMGLTAAAFVVLLSTTGILLNHTDALHLDRRYVQSAWLLDWYGIRAPQAMVSYAVADHWVTQLGERLYLGEQEVVGSFGQLVGAVLLEDKLIIAVQGELLLYSAAGELIERVSGQQGVPAGMHGIGVGPRGQLVIRSAHGYYTTDKDLLAWREQRSAVADWATAQSPAPELQERLRGLYRGKGLTVERVLLDLHSGRIFGAVGTLVVDAAAALLLLLAVSGLWIWGRRRS